MMRTFTALVRCCAVAIPIFAFLPLGPASWHEVPYAALAQTPSGAEAEAFAAAKELGTVEAWDAFLSHYPTGFHADLARAYVKKLAAGGAPAPTAPSAPQDTARNEPPAYEQTCTSLDTLRSRESKEPAKLHFVNRSDATLIVQWVDFKGGLKEYATLQPGAEYTQDTYITHPWIVAYQEGSCRQVFLPAPGVSVAYLRPEAELHDRASAPEPPAHKEAKAKSHDDEPSLKCTNTMKPWKGKCVPKSCRAHASRGADGDCYCRQGYRLQSGDCVRIVKVTCGPNQVFSSSMGQCISKSLGQGGRPPAPQGYKYDQNGNLMQDNGGGE